MMVHKIGLAVMAAGLLASAMGEDGKVEYKPLAFGGFSEFGLLRSGQYADNPAFKNEWIDHFGAYIAQTAVANENLAFDVGIGGVFEYQKAEVVSSQWGGTQYKNFFVGPAVADIRYGGSSRDGQGFGLQFGMFNYKYNPEASNLGEYLFRSGAYPDYITSGGFWFLNNATVQLQALKASYASGSLTSDFFLTTETSMPALYDISAAAVVGYKVADGLLNLGAGLNFKHLISVKPSHTSREVHENAYFKKDGKDYTGNYAMYNNQEKFYRRRAEEDKADSVALIAKAVEDSIIAANVKTWLANPAAAGITLKYYTQRGIILMARASLDLKKLMPSDAFGPNDLKLYAEGAILGVQNYPIYYEKITERMPIMGGINIPTFQLLDLLSVEAEYFNSPYPNSYLELVNTNSAIPTSPVASNKYKSETEYKDITKHDNLSWSVLAKKNFGVGAYVSGQVARDHIRTVSISTWTAPEPTEILGKSSDWYWMLQFGFGI